MPEEANSGNKGGGSMPEEGEGESDQKQQDEEMRRHELEMARQKDSRAQKDGDGQNEGVNQAGGEGGGGGEGKEGEGDKGGGENKEGGGDKPAGEEKSNPMDLLSGKDDASMTNWIFAALIAVCKDLTDPILDLMSGGITSLMGASESFIGPMTALIAAIPFIGTAISATIQMAVGIVFGGVGLSGELIGFIIHGAMAIMIYLLIGTKFSPTAKVLFIGLSVVDLFPFIRDLPLETASVIATFLIRQGEKTVKPLTKMASRYRKAKAIGRGIKKAGQVGKKVISAVT